MSQFVFVSERGAPLSTEGFSRLLQRAAVAAGLTIKVHPHMLRHACGFKLANDGVDGRPARPQAQGWHARHASADWAGIARPEAIEA